MSLPWEQRRKYPARVADVLSGPERWTQGYWAKDCFGGFVHFTSPLARCWCFWGAVELVLLGCDGGSGLESMRDEVGRFVVEKLNGGYENGGHLYVSPILWNDEFGLAFDEVKAMAARVDEFLISKGYATKELDLPL